MKIIKNYFKWLFKIGWVKTKSDCRMVYLKNGRCIGPEFHLEYTNKETREVRKVWIPAAP
jgi:hypothetical protein